MLKQSDAIIIFVVAAAAVAVLILSSNTSSLVVVGVLAMIFGGLVGARLQRQSASEHTDEAAEDRAAPVETPAPARHAAAPEHGPDDATEPAAAAPLRDTGAPTATRSRATDEAAAPSQIELLKNLVASVTEGITFKDPRGRYISANAAFAQMLGSQPSEIVGRDDAGVFGHLTAKSLLASDDDAAAKGCISTTLEVPLPDGPRFFEITKSSVSNDDDGLEGIVAVWRDVTEPATSRRRREKAMRETIMAFTKSIELRDAFLGDHARRLANLATAVADELALDDDTRTTVELAAYLSQIGKLGLDASLLSQERRFTETEIKEVQKHVHHTARLLRDLDFGLPVASTLFQIHERLDGTGYPQGLKASEIVLPARILGACDVFCARTAERSYRPAIAREAAIEILQQNPHRYDETVVAATKRVVLADTSAP